MRKTVVGLAIVLTATSTVALADVTRFIGPNGESCTRTTDENDNVATICSSPQQAGPTPRPYPDPAPYPSPAPPQQQYQQRRANLASIIVGKWRYNVNIKGNIVEATAAFGADHSYVLAVRFPNTPRLGQQVMVESGDYQVSGDVLTTNPSDIKVLRGPRSDQLCDLQARRCNIPPLTQTQVELQIVDRNTLQGNLQDSDFTAMRLVDQEEQNYRSPPNDYNLPFNNGGR